MTLQTRVTNILTKPAQEWRVVAAESADVAELMRDYAAPLAALTILAALYAIYLFYLGLPPLMNTPHEQVIPYMLVSALLVIVVSFVLGLVAATLVGGGSYVV